MFPLYLEGKIGGKLFSVSDYKAYFAAALAGTHPWPGLHIKQQEGKLANKVSPQNCNKYLTQKLAKSWKSVKWIRSRLVAVWQATPVGRSMVAPALPEPLYPWNPQDIIDTISINDINDINSVNDTGQQARHKPRGTWAGPTLLSFLGSRRFQRHHSILAILQIGTPTPFLRRDCFYKTEV